MTTQVPCRTARLSPFTAHMRQTQATCHVAFDATNQLVYVMDVFSSLTETRILDKSKRDEGILLVRKRVRCNGVTNVLVLQRLHQLDRVAMCTTSNTKHTIMTNGVRIKRMSPLPRCPPRTCFPRSCHVSGAPPPNWEKLVPVFSLWKVKNTTSKTTALRDTLPLSHYRGTSVHAPDALHPQSSNRSSVNTLWRWPSLCLNELLRRVDRRP